MGKIVQTAGRNTLGEFEPEFAHFNDDVLFGENWNNSYIFYLQSPPLSHLYGNSQT